MSKSMKTDRQIPYTLALSEDEPIAFRIRVESPSAEMRAFVVPAGAQRFSTEPPVEEKSGVRLKATG